MSIQHLINILIFINAVTAPPTQGTSVEYYDESNNFHIADSELGFYHKTDISLIRRTAVLETEIHLDSRGARVSQAAEPPVSRIDLLAVGGSQTFGPGVDNRQTFALQIASRLGVSARNFGVGGQGGVESLILLKRNIDLDPKVVVYGFWEDHFKRNVRICMARRGPVCQEVPAVCFDDMDRPYIRYPADAAGCFNRVRRWDLETANNSPYRTLRTDLKWTTHQWARDLSRALGSTVHSDPTDELMMKRVALYVMREMKKLAEAAGAKLVVVYIPLYFSDYVEPMPEDLAASTEEAGIIMVDMAGRFNEFKRQGIGIPIPGDGHLNAGAHAAIGEEVYRELILAGEFGG